MDARWKLMLRPFNPATGQPAMNSVESGDFTDHLIAERALAQALGTGKFAGGLIYDILGRRA